MHDVAVFQDFKPCNIVPPTKPKTIPTPPIKPPQPAATKPTVPKQEAPIKPQPQQLKTTDEYAQAFNQKRPRFLGDKLGADQYSNKSSTDEGQNKPKLKEPIKELTVDDVNKERVKEGEAIRHGSGGSDSDPDHGRKRLEKRSLTMELEMVSRQNEEYMKAVSDLVEEVRKQKKLVKVMLLTFLVLLFGIYVKNMQSSHLFERTPNANACQ